MKKAYCNYEGAKNLSKLISKINKAVREAGCKTSTEAAQVARKVQEKVQLNLEYRNIYEEELFRLIAQGAPFTHFKTELGEFLRAYKDDASDFKSRGAEGEFPIRRYPTLIDWLPKIHPFCLSEKQVSE